jgi:hypothetical protein
MKDLRDDHAEGFTELTESWSFRVNELLMEIALLRETA